MGPQHPSTHGVLHILLELDGEEIIAAEASLGYLHRGIEKLAEHRRYNAVGTLLDRGDYVSGIHTELASRWRPRSSRRSRSRARRSGCARCSASSTASRATSSWYGTFGLDAGAMAPFLYMMRDREALLDILEAITGARMMFNYVRPGGVLADLTPDGRAEDPRRSSTTFDGYLDEYDDAPRRQRDLPGARQGVGVIDRATAIAFGLTGAYLRALGRRLGRAHASARTPPTTSSTSTSRRRRRATAGTATRPHGGDAPVARGSSRQCLDGMPEGEYTAKVPKVLGRRRARRTPPSSRRAASSASTWSPTAPTRRTGCATARRRSTNLAVVDEVLPGHLIADAVVIIGSLDIVLGEIDR